MLLKVEKVFPVMRPVFTRQEGKHFRLAVLPWPIMHPAKSVNKPGTEWLPATEVLCCY